MEAIMSAVSAPVGPVIPPVPEDPEEQIQWQVKYKNNTKFKVEDEIPSLQLYRCTEATKRVAFNTLDEMRKGLWVVVTVPHSYSPTCNVQLPQYVSLFQQFVKEGVSKIAFVGVNSPDVMRQWLIDNKAPEGIVPFPDTYGKFVLSMGLAWDRTGERSLGMSAVRSFMVVKEGRVVVLQREPEAAPGQCDLSKAEKALDAVKALNKQQ